MKISLLLAWFAILTISVVAQENKQENGLKKLRSQKDAAIARATEPIDKRYVKELEALLKVLTTAGELEKALGVKKAIENVGKEISVSSEITESKRLALLTNQRNDAVEKARQPIQATYVAELQRMLRHATSSGKLEEAVEIKNELAQMGENKGPLVMEPGEGEFSGRSPDRNGVET